MPLSSEEYAALETSILRDGCRDAIVTWHGTIIDGHNRYKICTDNNIPFRAIEMEFDTRSEVEAWMIDNQLARRNLSDVDKIILAQQKTQILSEQARENQIKGKPLDNIDKRVNVRKEIAEITGISEGTIAKVRKIQTQQPELLDDIRRGQLSIDAAYKHVKRPYISNNSGESEWYTPERYIKMARSVMGSIDTDPASHDIPQQWIQAKKFYTAESNGLTHNWYGHVWLNPPYQAYLIDKFIEKFLDEWHNGHISQAIILVNNATETAWWQLLSAEANAFCFHKSRLRFSTGTTTDSAPMQGQCFLYFGDNIEQFATVFSQVGTILTPYKKYAEIQN